MAKASEMRFRFENDGKTFYEVSWSELPPVLEIGRSHSCACRLPETDKNASAHHARLEKTAKGVFICDAGSRNGILLLGQRIERRKVEIGDVYSIGECKMAVERDLCAVAAVETYHRLEQLSGAETGKTWPLEKPQTVVGSEFDADIRIPDLMVSRHHAVFEVKDDGSCWVRDLKSRNGTKVNGAKLTEEAQETGRLLKDGDIVSIAYVDYRFLDRRVIHVRSHFLRNFLAVLATLGIALGGWFGYKMLTPDAVGIRLSAEQLAAEGRFDEALAELERSRDARGGEEDADRRKEMKLKIELWKETLTTWEGIKARLSSDAPKLGEINTQFAPIVSSSGDNWKWNATSAPAEGRKARAAHEMLTTLLTARSAFTTSEPTAERIASLLKTCEAAVAAATASQEKYLAAPTAELSDLVSEMRATLGEHTALVAAMSGFSLIDKASETLRALRQVGDANAARAAGRKGKGLPVSPLVANEFRAFSDPVSTLADGFAALEANCRAAARMKWDEYKADLPLPTMEQCLCFSLLSSRRAELAAENAAVAEIIRHFKNFATQFAAAGIALGKMPPDCEKLFDQKRLERVLACDCLEKPAPGYSEKAPTSVYDETVGVHAFFAYLTSLDGEFDASVLEERFRPLLFKVPETLSVVESYLDFTYGRKDERLASAMSRVLGSCAGDDNAALAWAKHAEKLIAARTSFTRGLYRRFLADSTTRAGVIAGGMSCALRGRGTSFLPEELNAKVFESFRTIRKRVGAELLSDAQKTPEQKARVEAKALSIGIPGDSYLKQPWADSVKQGGGK